MKAAGYFLLLLFFFHGVSAQKSVKGLIEAETDFSNFAGHHGLKEAFLLYMDTGAVEFESGRMVKSRPLWKGRTDDNSVLKWKPQFAEVAASKDFGYTTGPWTFQPNQGAGISARGQTTTIWHYIDGRWKYLVDIGNDYKKTNTADNAVPIKVKTKKLKTDVAEAAMLEAENAFIAARAKDVKAAYEQVLSQVSILNRHAFLPATSLEDQNELIYTVSPGIEFKVIASRVAPSGDMGYVYGSTLFNGRRDVYLHIWRHEKKGWKLALEVLHH